MSKGNEPEVDVPGKEKSFKKHLLEIGSNIMQTHTPINQMHMHLCGFACYKDDPQRQVELNFWGSALNDEVIQCAIFDSAESSARLVGIEYVISERLFETLPPEEQKYWHSHMYDVKSASFIAPGIPDQIGNRLFEDLSKTYGKNWILWQTDRGDALPLGEPQLMMVATKDGQWNPELFERREAASGDKGSTERIREVRDKLSYPPPHPNADWNQSVNPSFPQK